MFEIKPKERISYALKQIALPIELHVIVDALAKKYNLSYSEIVKQCIEYSVEKMEK